MAAPTGDIFEWKGGRGFSVRIDMRGTPGARPRERKCFHLAGCRTREEAEGRAAEVSRVASLLRTTRPAELEAAVAMLAGSTGEERREVLRLIGADWTEPRSPLRPPWVGPEFHPAGERVYAVIYAKDTLVKIGFTTRLGERPGELRRKFWPDARLLASRPGDREEERRLRVSLHRWWVSGEDFQTEVFSAACLVSFLYRTPRSP